MKIRTAICKIILSILLTAPAAFGQTTRTWDGGGGNNILNTAANWSNDTAPTGANDTALWDGTVAGDLSLIWNANFGPTSGNAGGVNLNIAAGNTGSLQLDATSGGLGLGDITIASGAGAFTLGNGVGTASVLFRDPTTTLANNSANTATIKSDVVFGNGGGPGNRNITIGGSGNWMLEGTLFNSAFSAVSSALLSKTGSGTLTLGGANVHGGGTTISQGTIKLTHGNALGTGNVSITSFDARLWLEGGIHLAGVTNYNLSGQDSSDFAPQSKIFNASGSNSVAGNINFASFGGNYVNIHSDAGTLTLNGSMSVTFSTASGRIFYLTGAGDTVVNGAISDGSTTGGVGLVKAGGGTLKLNGVNTYSGTTTVSAGTLGGSGTVPGVVTVASGATLAPGNSIGTLNLGAAPTLGGTLLMEISTPASADKLNITSGTVSFGGTLTVINIGPSLANGDTFDLFDGSLSGSFTTVNLPGGAAHWNTSDLNIGGTLTFTNASPVAQNLTLGVVQGGSVSLPVIGGKYAPADADGDSMTITAVSAASSGTSGFTSSDVTYAATGGTGPDTFTYTVTDSLGATDTKTVTVIVTSPQGFNQLSATSGGGNAYLTYLGVPGSNYALEVTHDLPATNWTAVVTNAAAANGYLYFTNQISLAPTNDYYRTRYVSGP